MIRVVAIMVLSLLCCPNARAVPLDLKLANDAKEFLKKYLEFNNSGNVELANLYSPSAEISLNIIKQYGQPKQTVISGLEWARLLRETFIGNQTAPEQYELHNVSVSGNGAYLEITAQRYSTSRCYFDNDYKMVISKEAQPAYRIIKENLFINHNDLCQPADSNGFTVNQNIRLNQP